MKLQRLDKYNIAKIKDKSGLYQIHTCTGKRPIYVGVSKVLKHRLQSYYQQDDFNAHQTKEPLRQHACKFTYKYMPISQARKLEMKIKKNHKFNVS